MCDKIDRELLSQFIAKNFALNEIKNSGAFISSVIKKLEDNGLSANPKEVASILLKFSTI